MSQTLSIGGTETELEVVDHLVAVPPKPTETARRSRQTQKPPAEFAWLAKSGWTLVDAQRSAKAPDGWPLFRTRSGETGVVSPNLHMRFKPNADLSQIAATLAKAGATYGGPMRALPGVHKAQVAQPDHVFDTVRRLATLEEIAWVEPMLIQNIGPRQAVA